jgi:hypothetical protein
LVKDLNGFERGFKKSLTNFIIKNLKQQPFHPLKNINLECILTMNSIVKIKKEKDLFSKQP